MEIPKTTADAYRVYLTDCEYPNISNMDNKDIEKLLSKENRLKFLTWVLIKFNPTYEMRVEHLKIMQKLETFIAETLYSNGCCLNSQKLDFVLGKLHTDEEIKIFNRIFKFLSLVNKNVDRENMTPQTGSIVYSLQHLDKDFDKKVFVTENLFEERVNIKEEDRIKFQNKFEKENAELDQQLFETQNEIEEIQKQINNDKTTETEIAKEDMENTSKKLSKLILDFGNDIPEYSAHFLKLPEKVIDDELGTKVKICNENIQFMKKILDNKNYINNINPLTEESETSILSEYVANNFALSEELYFEE